MPRIALLTSFITSGDAVSNDVLGMHRALGRAGHDVRIYAERWTIAEPRVWPAEEVKDFVREPADLLIYHHSIGWDSGPHTLGAVTCRTAVRYHNVTPPHFFVDVSPWHEEMCRSGREQMRHLARANHDLYLAASHFNAAEVAAEGVDQSRNFVVVPFHAIDRLRSLEPDLGVLDAYRDGKTNLLMVGRVAPNKGQADAIEAFAVYSEKYNYNSRLLIVGREEEPFAAYSARLRQSLDLYWLREAVVFTGEVSESALKAYYLAAHAFLMTSEHEGFCVPLVEAMAMKVPIVAYASSAIPETVGGAGLVWAERNPFLLAESIDLLVRDESHSAALGWMGWRRYERHFTSERIGEKLLRALGPAL